MVRHWANVDLKARLHHSGHKVLQGVGHVWITQEAGSHKLLQMVSGQLQGSLNFLLETLVQVRALDLCHELVQCRLAMEQPAIEVRSCPVLDHETENIPDHSSPFTELLATGTSGRLKLVFLLNFFLTVVCLDCPCSLRRIPGIDMLGMLFEIAHGSPNCHLIPVGVQEIAAHRVCDGKSIAGYRRFLFCHHFLFLQSLDVLVAGQMPGHKMFDTVKPESVGLSHLSVRPHWGCTQATSVRDPFAMGSQRQQRDAVNSADVLLDCDALSIWICLSFLCRIRTPQLIQCHVFRVCFLLRRSNISWPRKPHRPVTTLALLNHLAQIVRIELVLRQHAGTNPASDFLLLCQEILQVGIGLGVANLDLLVGFVPAKDSAFFRALKFAEGFWIQCLRLYKIIKCLFSKDTKHNEGQLSPQKFQTISFTKWLFTTGISTKCPVQPVVESRKS